MTRGMNDKELLITFRRTLGRLESIADDIDVSESTYDIIEHANEVLARHWCECLECNSYPHNSDCGVHNAPAEPKTDCTCKAEPIALTTENANLLAAAPDLLAALKNAQKYLKWQPMGLNREVAKAIAKAEGRE